MSEKKKAGSIVREIRRKTRKKYSSEEKSRIVLEALLFLNIGTGFPWPMYMPAIQNSSN